MINNNYDKIDNFYWLHWNFCVCFNIESILQKYSKKILVLYISSL